MAPNLALVPALKAAGYDIYYIGSHGGIEQGLVEAAGIPYFAIASGKLRRYKSAKNITDIFRVGKGLLDALGIIRKIKPDIVFSKGGFVVVPVIAAARLLGVKSVIHESDMTPGLANKLAMPFAAKICVSFKETLNHVPAPKGILTGTPIRAALLAGDPKAGLAVFDSEPADNRPVLLITGGSQGANAINTCVTAALPLLLKQFRVVHLCGKGNLSGIQQPGYAAFEYLHEKMADVLAAADLVVSRAGANTLFELVSLHKPNLLIPLPAGSSRGDQLQNAASFEKAGLSMVLYEQDMTPERLVHDVVQLYENRRLFSDNMKAQEMTSGVKNVMDVIEGVVNGKDA